MFLHQLKNREEKEKYFLKILKILKIEKKKRNEISFLEIERDKSGSFLSEIFSRSRLLSMSALPIPIPTLFPVPNFSDTTRNNEQFPVPVPVPIRNVLKF